MNDDTCPYCGFEITDDPRDRLTCPNCYRDGCPDCMPGGVNCMCPECEENPDRFDFPGN